MNKIDFENMECNFSHVNCETNQIMNKNKRIKKKWIGKNHFVYYKQAQECLKELDLVIELGTDRDDDYIEDMEGLSLIGNTGLGKTAIINQCLRTHQSDHYEDYETFVGRHCLLKDEIAGLRGLYSALLEPLGHRYGNYELVRKRNISISSLENVLLHLLNITEVKIYFIDEFQHVRGRNQDKIINQLKRTMLKSGVPFIPVGMPAVVEILGLDTQLADRCPVKECTHLKYWTYKNSKSRNGRTAFRKFLKGYETFLPFPEPSGLSREKIARAIFDKIKFNTEIQGYEYLPEASTNLRRVARYIKRIAIKSLKNNEECITEEIIDDTDL